MQQLALIGPPAPPPPARKRCPLCHAGFAPLTVTERVAEQRAAAGRDYASEWQALLAARPEVAQRVALIALTMHAAKPDGRLSIDAVWNRYADEHGEAIDNNLRAPAARHLMREHPALSGRFVTRDRAGQVKERAR